MFSFEDLIEVITNNLFSQVSVLIGIIAIIGLALQRKPFEQVVAGGLRATIGVVVLNIGVEIFVGGLVSFQAIVASAMGLEPPTSDATLTGFTTEGPGTVVPLIIAGGFLVHLVFVRIFKAARFVYLTGHLMYWMSVVIAASLVEAFGDVNRWVLAGVGSLLIGCYWVLQPLWTAPVMRKVMGNEDIGLAHTDSVLAVASAYGAKALRLGDPKKHDSENLNLPRALSFFKDINVSTAFVIGVIMLVAIAFADAAVVTEQMAGSTVLPAVWALLQALRFAAGIAILLFGVRMFLAEIVPAFKGLSEKALPGSKPALDLPVTFTQAPTAVIVGFLASAVVFLVLMGVFAGLGWFVLVPPMIMLFFGGAAGGVFGNAVAGWRGAVFGGVLNGVFLAFGQWISWGVWNTTAPELATLIDSDWVVVGWTLAWLGQLLAPLGAAAPWVLAVVMVAVTIAVLVLAGRRMPAQAELSEETETHAAFVDPAAEATIASTDAVQHGAQHAPVAVATTDRPETLTVLAVCGAGMGSSLILRTTAQKALEQMGVPASLDHADVGSARGQRPHVVIGQPSYLSEVGGIAPVAVPITSFVDVKHVRERLEQALTEKGWL
ncbi:PTS ascorbate transporter subunit IIC [Microbacterium sp. MEC084]|uniref:PTS transporter subunit IIC n=1 Tax=Microbacterium sp. MEC084 TaxID=1963027 RepID=UPI001070009E|nr:PTS transporter subunit IIC [Microbacterium sp. MEC084]MCD1267628.1 PTS ascorbate transporter subunit IIC [Microbacterium sp. MEC084]